MIEQVLSNNILHEAANLLKKQNKLNNNDDIGTSFEDLFQISNSKNIKNSNNDISDIVITFSDKNNQNSHDILNNDNKLVNNQSEENKYNKDANLVNSNLNEEKNVKNKSKNIIKNQKNEDLENGEISKNDLKLEKSSINKESIESITIKYRYGNVELKSDLDFNSKLRIKNILQDLKSGKIDENIANAFILQVIRNSHINGLGALIKNKDIKVEIKKEQNNDKLKSSVLNAKNKDLGINKDENTIKNNKSNLNNFLTEENKTTSKVNNKLKSNETKEIKDEEIKLKDLKSEIKLNDFDNKSSNVAFQKDIVIDSRKTLDDNKKALFDQVVKNTKIVLDQNQAKFSTMIRPENLGRIDFQFVVKDGKMNGRMILQNQEVVDFFKSNVEELKAVMQKSNVELENIEIILAGNRFGETANNNNQSSEFVNSDNSNFQNNVFSKNIDVFEENISSEQMNYSKRDKTRINIII